MSDRLRLCMYVGAGGVASVVVVLVALAFWFPDAVERAGLAPSAWLGSTANRVDESAPETTSSPDPTPDEGEKKAREPYEPTSEYLAEGFDPEERVLDFSSSRSQSREGPQTDILTSSDVQRILYERADELIPCYQKVLDERPKATGEVGFAFGIDTDGEVLMVRITDSELRHREAEDCLVRKARGWNFPRTHLDFVTKFDTGMLFRLN